MTLTPHALTAVHKQALGQAVPSVTAALPVAAVRTVRAACRQAGLGAGSRTYWFGVLERLDSIPGQ